MGVRLSIFLCNSRSGRRDFFYDDDDDFRAVRTCSPSISYSYKPDRSTGEQDTTKTAGMIKRSSKLGWNNDKTPSW
jgi:hypothetical protein